MIGGDDVLGHQLREERVQVDVLVQIPTLLQHAHPAHRFLDVPAALQEEMVEEPPQTHLGEELANEIGIEEGVAGTHGVLVTEWLSSSRSSVLGAAPRAAIALSAEHRLPRTG